MNPLARARRLRLWLPCCLGLALLLLGAGGAHLVQTSSGIHLRDIRFTDDAGNILSALLYVPASATSVNPAPGVLAVHGYINSRETQSGFAIEFARRGYVVLALDQRGHGYSAPPALADGFGGPAALTYLRQLPMVDRNNIGLEGHSMGGWAVLAAAAAEPSGYRSMVLEGSTTGAPFARAGDPSWPRNVAVVFSEFDEFSELMWGVPHGRAVPTSPKLQALFDSTGPVIADQLYGSIADGTARILHQPPVTHPGDHLSREAIGHALDWFGTTLDGGQPRPSTDQIWWWKELATLLAFGGWVLALIGAARALLQTSPFQPLATQPNSPLKQPGVFEQRSPRWWWQALAASLLPALTFYPLLALGERWLPASAWLPQAVTNQIVVWALGNAALGFALNRLTKHGADNQPSQLLRACTLALLTLGLGYGALWLVDRLFLVDLRFWVVALKLMSPAQFKLSLIYSLPFIALFLVTLNSLHGRLRISRDGALGEYLANGLILTGGLLALLLAQYGTLFSTGALLTPSQPLNTIIMMQFVPILLIVALVSTALYRKTGSVVPGALLCGLFVSWYVVAGQATHLAA